MKPLLLSCALILAVSNMALSAPSLSASGNESAKPPANNPVPSKGEKQKPTPKGKAQIAKSNPLPASKPTEVVSNPSASKEENSPTKKPEQPEKYSFWPTMGSWPDWLLVLVGIGTVLVALGTLKILGSQAQSALEGTRAITLAERAYVKMTHLPPGLNFGPISGNFWVQLRVQNVGKTPARITATVIKAHPSPLAERLPRIPDYSGARVVVGRVLLLTNEHVGTTAQGTFTSSDIETEVREGRLRWVIYGYVDYIDQFERHHRAGYAREYDRVNDDPERYSAEDYGGRSNLTFVPEPDYNYDRQRQHGDGDDWNEPV